jgi:hypothetical protein
MLSVVILSVIIHSVIGESANMLGSVMQSVIM